MAYSTDGSSHADGIKNEKQLNQINGRVRRTEEKVGFIEGIGSVLSVIFTISIGWLFRR